MIGFKQFIDRVYSLAEPLFKEPKKHLKTWLAILGVLVASWAVVFLLRSPEPTRASWWDETWLYRRAIQISNDNGEDLEDFQVAITLDTASLITDGKMQNDCSDLRTTDNNGNLIPHWIEENNPGCNDAATKVWTKVPTVYDGTDATTVYIYYGNANASSVENGDNVFEFFDDFEDGVNTAIWNTDSDYEVVDGELKIWGSDNTALYSKESFSGDIKVVSRVMKESDGDLDSGFWLSYNGGSVGALVVLDDINNGNHNGISMGTWATMATTFSNNPTDSSWHSLSAWRYGGNMYANFSDETINTTNNYTTNPIGIFSDSDSSARKMRVDHIAVCKAVSSEPTTSLDSEEISPGPVAHWKFDEGEGTTAHDSSGQGNDGTLVNGPTWQTEENCISGKCHSFNASEYVDLGNPKSLQITGSQTISMWLKPANFSARRNPYAKAYGGEGTITQETSGALNYYYGTAGTNSSPYQGFNSSQSLTLNEWNHIAIVRDLENMKLHWYINGKETNEANASYAAATASSLTAYIGHGYTNRYAGLIDEVKVYPYARSEEQIKIDYATGASSKGSGAVFGHKAETAQITPISSKLIAHWKFDEGYGETAHDSSRNNFHGTMGAGDSAPSWTNEGKFGKALSFDGVDDYISVIDPTGNLNPGTGDFTLSAWIYKPSDGKSAPGIISKNGNPGFKFNINSGNRLLLAIYDGSWHDFLSSTSIIEMDKWQHVVVVADRDSNANFFVNEENAGSQDISSMSSVNLSNSSSLRIGDDNWCRSYYCGQYDGKIDEVKIYNYALTPEEVKQDYNQGKAAVMGQSSTNTGSTAPGGSAAQEYCVPGSSDTCRPPVAEWDFEEGSGDTVYDKSGNGNDGTITGTSWTTGKIGKGLKFTNSSDLVEVPNLPDNLGGFTVNVWARVIKTADWGYIFHRSTNTSIGGSIIWIGVNSDDDYAASVNGRYTQGATNVAANKEQWRFISLTYDGSTQRIFIDGQLLVSDTFGSIGNSASDNLSGIGGTPHNTTYRPVEGDIDNITVYDYARTPAQIAWDYNRGAPVGHWKFNECQGTVAHDASGNENHGTINIGSSAPQTSAGTCTSENSAHAWYNGKEGKINSAMSFDGVDDWVDVGNDESLNISNNIFTISAWVETSDTGAWKWIYQFGEHASTKDRALVIDSNNKARMYVYGTNAISTTIVTDGEWHHLVGTIDGTNARIYVDGNLEHTTQPSLSAFNYTGARIGKVIPGDTYWFNGLIDDVRIYNYALTPLQIKTLYNDGAAVKFGN